MSTSGTNGVTSERDEIEMLMPWYVTGRLEASDRERVDRYLERHPEARRLVDLALEEADEMLAIEQTVPGPSRDAFKKIMARIESLPAQRIKISSANIWQSVQAWLDQLSPRALAMTGTAAALIIFAQAASIGTLLLERGAGSGYVTATGQRPEHQPGTYALVKFNPAATAEGITSYLSETGAAIVDGPRANGLYRVKISTTALAPEAAADLLSKLQSRDDIVGFAALTP